MNWNSDKKFRNEAKAPPPLITKAIDYRFHQIYNPVMSRDILRDARTRVISTGLDVALGVCSAAIKVGRVLERFSDQLEKADIARELARYRHWEDSEASMRTVYRAAIKNPWHMERLIGWGIKEWGEPEIRSGPRSSVIIRRHERKFPEPMMQKTQSRMHLVSST